jgi:MSHA biogenesis protein MshO
MRQHGMTLIELVITITVGSIVVGFMSMFITLPMNAYSAQTRRAALVDSADSALRFMARDISASLPNSVRTGSSGTITALELLATVDGARYRDGGPLADPALELDFSSADTAFSTTVPFTQLTLPWSSGTSYLSIANIGVPGADAYASADVITPAPTSITVSAGATANANLVTMNPGFRFKWGSPNKRVYLVSGPVSYLCDSAARTLTRYSGYTILATQALSAASLLAANATAARVATDVAGCAFSYAAGSPQRNALATLTLQLSNSGETIQLLQQVQLANSP